MISKLMQIAIRPSAATYSTGGMEGLDIKKRLARFKQLSDLEQIEQIFLAIGSTLLRKKGQLPSDTVEGTIEKLMASGHLLSRSNLGDIYNIPIEHDLVYRAIQELKIPIKKLPFLGGIEESTHIEYVYNFPFSSDRTTPGFQDRTLFTALLDRHPLFAEKRVLVFPGCSNLGPMIEAIAAGLTAFGVDLSRYQMETGVATGIALGIDPVRFSLFEGNVLHQDFQIRGSLKLGDQPINIISLLPPAFSPKELSLHLTTLRKGLTPIDRVSLFYLRYDEGSSYFQKKKADAANPSMILEEGNVMISPWFSKGQEMTGQAFYSTDYLVDLSKTQGSFRTLSVEPGPYHGCLILQPMSEFPRVDEAEQHK